MSSKKKIVALIAGVITALLLIYSYGDLSKTIGFIETQKPATNAPAFLISK